MKKNFELRESNRNLHEKYRLNLNIPNSIPYYSNIYSLNVCVVGFD